MSDVCRSGAIYVGDRILAVDGARTLRHTADEVSAMIRANKTQRISLELLPLTVVRKQAPPRVTSGNDHNYNYASSKQPQTVSFFVHAYIEFLELDAWICLAPILLLLLLIPM